MSGVLEPQVEDVLLNSTGTGTIGRSCVFDGQGRFIVDGHVTVLRLRPEAGIGRWLCAVLRTPWGQTYLENQCYSGSTNQVELSRRRLAATRLPIPPLPEQQRIAEVLDTVAEAIRKTDEVIAKLRLVKQGLLQDLLTRGIADNGDLRDPEHAERFQDSPVGQVPRTWAVEPLGEVAEIIDPNPSHRYPDEVRRGVPIASTENFVDEDGFDLTSSKRVPDYVFDEQQRRCNYRPSDIVFARKGRIGFARPYGEARKVFSHTVVLIKPRTDRVTPSYLLWSVRSGSFFRGIRDRMNANVGVPTLGVGFLGRVPIAVPPIAEQACLAERLDGIAQSMDAERAKLRKLRLLKQGLMQDLLTGRVRVAALRRGAE